MRYWTACSLPMSTYYWSTKLRFVGNGGGSHKTIKPKDVHTHADVVYMVDPTEEELQKLNNAVVFHSKSLSNQLPVVAALSFDLYKKMEDERGNGVYTITDRPSNTHYDLSGTQFVINGVISNAAAHMCSTCDDVLKHAAGLCDPGWGTCFSFPFKDEAKIVLPPIEAYVGIGSILPFGFYDGIDVTMITNHIDVTKDNVIEYSGRSKISEKAAITCARKRYVCKHCIFSVKAVNPRGLVTCGLSGRRRYNGNECDRLLLKNELPKKLTPKERLDTRVYGTRLSLYTLQKVLYEGDLLVGEDGCCLREFVPFNKKLHNPFWLRGRVPFINSYPVKYPGYVGINITKYRINTPNKYIIKKSSFLRHVGIIKASGQPDAFERCIYMMNELIKNETMKTYVKNGWGTAAYDIVAVHAKARPFGTDYCAILLNNKVTNFSLCPTFSTGLDVVKEFSRFDVSSLGFTTCTQEAIDIRSKFICGLDSVEQMKKADKYLTLAEEGAFTGSICDALS